MKNNLSFKLILTAMFAAIVALCTLVVQIPSPMGGYVNLGDAPVLMSGFLLGPWFGAAAAGIGSMLADLISGYGYYAPGTLIVKALTALTAALLLRLLASSPLGTRKALLRGLAALAGEAVMVAGYLFYAWFCLGEGAAAIASVPGNLVQAAVGLLIAILLTPIISRPREVQEMLRRFQP